MAKSITLKQERILDENMDIIGQLGVSKRLGSSVVNELDTRADAKFEQLKNDTNEKSNENDPSTFSNFFQLKHKSQFKRMDSLNTHYASASSIIAKVPKTPKRQQIDISEPRVIDDNVKDDDPSIKSVKRFKKVTASPPVNDITRRIRRLRLRTSLAGNSNNNNNNNNNNYNSNSNSIRNTPLTRQRPMEPPSQLPTFLRPTVNFLNKTTNEQQQRKEDKQALPRSISASKSVFDRLYAQNSISRSNSMNDVNLDNQPTLTSRTSSTQAETHSQSQTSRAQVKSRQKLSGGMSRSQTSSTLSNHLRPAWR